MSHLTTLAECLRAGGLQEAMPLPLADVGANPTRRPHYQDLLEAGLAEVWGFEPNPYAFAKLHHGPQRHWIKAAIGAPGPSKFYAYPATEMSSVYPLSEAS